MHSDKCLLLMRTFSLVAQRLAVTVLHSMTETVFLMIRKNVFKIILQKPIIVHWIIQLTVYRLIQTPVVDHCGFTVSIVVGWDVMVSLKIPVKSTTRIKGLRIRHNVSFWRNNYKLLRSKWPAYAVRLVCNGVEWIDVHG